MSLPSKHRQILMRLLVGLLFVENFVALFEFHLTKRAASYMKPRCITVSVPGKQMTRLDVVF